MNPLLRALGTLGLFLLMLGALALFCMFVIALGGCSETLPSGEALYARSAVDARVREFKLDSRLREAHCTTSHSHFAQCSGLTEHGKPCRFTCWIDACEWNGLQ
jgi:hypothetical protein